MAQTITVLTIRNAGFDQAATCFAAINEALTHAHIDDMIEIECQDGEVRFRGTMIAETVIANEDRVIVATIRPTAGMHLFAAWVMIQLPSRATITWNDGWPHIQCPPNDDRDIEAGPAPLVPNELVPA